MVSRLAPLLAVWLLVPAVPCQDAKPTPPPAEPVTVRPKGRSSTVPASAAAVQRGLDWLRRHQEPDGHWSAAGFSARCGDTKGCGGPGAAVNDVGVTGLALLAFVAAGTARDGAQGDIAKQAARWLVDQQGERGLIGTDAGSAYMYGHGIATWALLEAYGAGVDAELEGPARRAVAFILMARNPFGVWRYAPRDGDNDSSISGWMALALGAAQARGFTVDPRALSEILRWYDKVTEPETGRCGYTRRGEGSARDVRAVGSFPADLTEALTALAVSVRLSLGQTVADEPILEKAAKTMLGKPPKWSEDGSIDHYYWFHGSHAFRGLGEPRLAEWRQHLVPMVVEHQCREEHAAGSWDPVDPWGHNGGRVYSTALATLSLIHATSKTPAPR